MRPLPLHEVIETARIAALNSYAILDTLGDAQFDALAQAAAAAASMPMAQISFLDRTRQWVKAASGPRASAVPRHLAFCQGTLDVPAGLLWISDTQGLPRYEQHPWVAGPPRIRSYAGAVLIDHDGYRLGTLAAQDTVPRSLDPKVLERLGRLAAEVVAVMDRHRANRDLPLDPMIVQTAPEFRTVASLGWLPGQADGPMLDGLLAGIPNGLPAALARVSAQGWLGVRTGPAARSGDGDVAALPVLSVAQDSPAERAGVQIGDLLLTIDSRPIRRSADIQGILADRPDGSIVALSLRRAGEPVEVWITIEPLPDIRTGRRRTLDRGRR